MGFAQDVQTLRPKIEMVMESMKVLTPDRLKAIEALDSYDFELLEKIVVASEKIQDARRDVLLAENGLSDIKRVVEMQNQVHFVSDARDSIGLVAGNIEKVKAVEEDLTYIRAATSMEEMIKEVLKQSINIDKILDMEDSINIFIDKVDKADEQIEHMENLVVQAKNASTVAINMVNKANIIEKRIDEKLKRMEAVEKTMQEFSVKVEHVSSDRNPAHAYDRSTNTLELIIPRGKMGPKGQFKGDPGRPGRDGKDFKPTLMGTKDNMPRYGSRPMGTSYLSLDEIPTMIYFRKSDTQNDWTDGQPFGVGGSFYEGGDTSIVNGINVQKLTDFVVNEINKRKEKGE